MMYMTSTARTVGKEPEMLNSALKKVVEGTHLSRDEARQVMDSIMEGQATAAQIAALLVALRMKVETVDEITGFVESMRAHAVHISPSSPNLVDTCGTGGDGANTFNVSTVAAFVAAGAGVHIAKHGNRAISSKCGSADLLEMLGVDIHLPPMATSKAIEEVGIGFMFAPLYHPAMKHAGPVRKELGIRTVFNILGPMTNPAGAKRQVMGVFRKDLTHTIAQVLANLGTEYAWIVHGDQGIDEISLTGETHVVELKNGKISERVIRPEEFGFTLCKIDDLKSGEIRESKEITLRVLQNEEKGPKRDWVILNAAAAVLVGDKAKDFPSAIDSARKSIETGAAYEKLLGLIKIKQ